MMLLCLHVPYGMQVLLGPSMALVDPWNLEDSVRMGQCQSLTKSSEMKESFDFTFAALPSTEFNLFQADIFQKQQTCPIFKAVLVQSLLSLMTFSDG